MHTNFCVNSLGQSDWPYINLTKTIMGGDDRNSQATLMELSHMFLSAVGLKRTEDECGWREVIQ